MKKQSLFCALAATMLLATSCQTDANLGLNGAESLVTINLSTPEIATRTYSDGTMAKNLQYAVYDEAGNLLPNLTVTDATINLKTNVELQLTTGNKFTLVFWADAESAPYEVDFAAKTMTVNYDGVVSNREDLDAFYRDTTFTVTGRMNVDIDLYRPFAQLNIGTSDLTATTNAGYTVTHAAVTTDTYKTFNFITRTVSDPVEVTYAMNRIVRDAQPAEVFPVAGYDYVAMNYVLMTNDKAVNDYVTLTYTNGSVEKTRTFTAIPLQRNYRTNIFGQLFTSDVDVNVEIIPTYFKHDYNNPSNETDAVVAEVGALKAAIEAATDGAVINVLNGTYDVNSLDIKNKNITLLSNGATIKGMVYLNNSNVKFKGFTFTNPEAKLTTPANAGDLVDQKVNGMKPVVGVYTATTVAFENCVFDLSGDVVYGFSSYASTNATFENCYFNCFEKRPIATNGANTVVNGCSFDNQYHYSLRLFENNQELQTVVYTNNTITGSNSKGEFEGINISKKGNNAVVLGNFTIKGNTVGLKYRHHKNVTMDANCEYDTDIANFAFEREQ